MKPIKHAKIEGAWTQADGIEVSAGIYNDLSMVTKRGDVEHVHVSEPAGPLTLAIGRGALRTKVFLVNSIDAFRGSDTPVNTPEQ